MSQDERESRLKPGGWRFAALLAAAFLFRLGFGLCGQFQDSDTKQVYLLGLKFYATGEWPYFGPDVVWGEIQLPGALQALLVGLPFHALPLAEAPYLLLNLVSFASLCLFAWYCCRRLPSLPRWFVWGWLMTSPWTLNLSTVIYNPSYMLAGGILFFVGALELYPFTRRGLVPGWLANASMGFALFWSMQLHMSWVVLVPYALAALGLQMCGGVRRGLAALGWFAAGAAPMAALLAPTYLKYGPAAGGTAGGVRFNPENVTALWGILQRTLSFATFEVARFLGPHTRERLAVFGEQPWLAPFALLLLALGVAQVAALLACWFMRGHTQGDWRAVKYLALANVLLLYASFLFSIKPPQSNHLYVTLPLPVLYAFYCWDRLRLLAGARRRRLAAAALACGVIFHAGLAAYNFSHISLYVDRRAAQAAVSERNYHILGERRPGSRY